MLPREAFPASNRCHQTEEEEKNRPANQTKSILLQFPHQQQRQRRRQRTKPLRSLSLCIPNLPVHLQIPFPSLPSLLPCLRSRAERRRRRRRKSSGSNSQRLGTRSRVSSGVCRGRTP